jgi:SulP family sulfate permease
MRAHGWRRTPAFGNLPESSRRESPLRRTTKDEMSRQTGTSASAGAFGEMFTPKLVTILREGYGLAAFRADALAGLTVAIVALPLSMAIAIGSGAKPEQGLIAAVVGGFIVSALGGSRFQIGGPAGAFIVLVASVIERHGYQGFLAAVVMAGVFLLAIGYLQLGAFIKYIPQPVMTGFTAGIALIIFAAEIKDFFGLALAHEPGPLIPKLVALWGAAPSLHMPTTLVGVGALALILVLRRAASRFPGLLVAVALSALAVWGLGLPVETIGTKFGGVPNGLPAPALPTVAPASLPDLLPAALAIALLGGMESLLSAVVADGMSGRRHRSNCELVAQGWANIGSALFGGLCVTGTIARTATNIRAHAHGPVAGMLHAVFLLAFMILAAPLANWIPLSALAAVLAVVAWNMVERDHIRAVLRGDRAEAAVLLATFLLTAFHDLTVGIGVGVAMGALLFMHRMAQMVEVTTHAPLLAQDRADADAPRAPYDPAQGPRDVAVYRIAGPFFFGAATQVAGALEQIGPPPRAFVLDLSAVPLIDETGVHALSAFVTKAERAHARVFVAGASRSLLRRLLRAGLNRRQITYVARIDDAYARIARADAGADQPS